jgi:AcrR family transcriptional regulator
MAVSTASSRRLPFRTRDPDRTREQILSAAFAEFVEKGPAGARIDEIAERAGVNKRMIYHYFGGKDQLFQELLERKISETRGLEGEMPPDFAVALGQWQHQMVRDVSWVRLLMWEALSYRPGRIANQEERRGLQQSRVAETRHAQDEGLVDAQLDPAQLELSLLALVTFPVAFPQYTRLITGRDVSDPDFLEERKRFLARLFQLLGPGSI